VSSIARTLAQAKALYRAGQLHDAEQLYRQVLAAEPGNAEAHHNLGGVLTLLDRSDEAAACYRRTLELEPGNAAAYHNLGVVLVREGRLEEALPYQRRAVALRGDSAEIHCALGGTLLMMGRLDEGWPEYEWRWKLAGTRELPRQCPRWTGTSLAGRTILLDCEQAYGDTLQFIRYAELLKRQGATVIVECMEAIASLLARCPGVDRVVVAGQPLPDVDVHIPLLSLPTIFRTSLESIPADVPYLRPDPALVESWKNELSSRRELKIGIAWQGNPGQASDRFRSFPLAQFAAIARMPDVQLHSLQMGSGREQLSAFGEPSPVVDLGDRLGDFHDTAAIVSNLDLLITCDSAPAHLAGALGIKVWVALTLIPDWRWMLGRNDSPWYPSMRLFRQNRPGDWDAVFRNIQAALGELVAAR
jgi:hypothetical protein